MLCELTRPYVILTEVHPSYRLYIQLGQLFRAHWCYRAITAGTWRLSSGPTGRHSSPQSFESPGMFQVK